VLKELQVPLVKQAAWDLLDQMVKREKQEIQVKPELQDHKVIKGQPVKPVLKVPLGKLALPVLPEELARKALKDLQGLQVTQENKVRLDLKDLKGRKALLGLLVLQASWVLLAQLVLKAL